MSKTNWTRARAANRPTKSKLAQYDRNNELAAGAILRTPEQHIPLQVEWARRFRQRRAQEGSALILRSLLSG